MSLSNAQLQIRIEAIEKALEAIQIGIANLVDSKTVNAILIVKQKEITELQSSLSALSAKVDTLQAVVNAL